MVAKNQVKVGDRVFRLQGSLSAFFHGLADKPKHGGMEGEVLRVRRRCASTERKYKDARIRVKWSNGHVASVEECRLVKVSTAQELNLVSVSSNTTKGKN